MEFVKIILLWEFFAHCQHNMSFLAELQSRKTQLKPTATLVRYADGSMSQIQNGITTVTKSLPSQQYGYVVDTAPDNTPACILPTWLYLGSQDCVDTRVFAAHGITHCLSIGIEPPVQPAGVQYKFLPCLDIPETNLVALLGESGRFLEAVGSSADGSAVLVHCNAGVSRSASIVVAYLMQYEQMRFADAIALVKAKRTCCRPNDGFVRQLKELDVGK